MDLNEAVIRLEQLVNIVPFPGKRHYFRVAWERVKEELEAAANAKTAQKPEHPDARTGRRGDGVRRTAGVGKG